MLFSILINNYNYGPYLAQAIDSALTQSWPSVQVIVVDDGSSDDSVNIIESYGSDIVAILKENGGQASCVNAGAKACTGEFLIVLDSDDYLLPDAVRLHAERLQDSAVVSSSGYLSVVDADGNPLNQRVPNRQGQSGDYAAATLEHGLDIYNTTFTSGFAWRKAFLDQVLPLPETEEIGVDGYLTAADRYFGRVEFIHEPVGYYRRHGDNKGPMTFQFTEQYLQHRVSGKAARIRYSIDWARHQGYTVDEEKISQVREWRNVLMRHALSLVKNEKSSVGIAELANAPFRRAANNLPRSLALSISLMAVKLLPRKLALDYSEYLLYRARRVRYR